MRGVVCIVPRLKSQLVEIITILAISKLRENGERKLDGTAQVAVWFVFEEIGNFFLILRVFIWNHPDFMTDVAGDINTGLIVCQKHIKTSSLFKTT